MTSPFHLAGCLKSAYFKALPKHRVEDLVNQEVEMASLIIKNAAPSLHTGLKIAAGSTIARRFASSDKDIQRGTIDTDVYPADAVSGAPGQLLDAIVLL